MSNVNLVDHSKTSLNFVNQNKEQSPESLLTIMKQISEVLNRFEAEIAQFDTTVQNKQADAAKAAAKIAEEMMSKAEKELKQIEKQEHEQSKRSFWGKVFKVAAVVAIVVGVVAFIALGQPEIALAIGVAGAAGMAGLYEDAAKGLSKLLQMMGVPPKIADITADAIVMAATIILTMGYGEFAGLEAGAEIVGEEVAEETATEAATEGSSEATESLMSRAQNMLSDLKDAIGNKAGQLSRFIGPKVGLTMTVGATALSNLNVAQDLLAALPLSEKKRKKLFPIIEAVQILAALLTALMGGGGLSIAATASAAADAGEEPTTAQKAFVKLDQFLSENPGVFLNLQRVINLGAGTGSGVVRLLNGLSELEVAKATEKLGAAQAEQQIAMSIQGVADSGIRQSGQAFTNDINTVSEELEIVHHMGDFLGETAQLTTA